MFSWKLSDNKNYTEKLLLPRKKPDQWYISSVRGNQLIGITFYVILEARDISDCVINIELFKLNSYNKDVLDFRSLMSLDHIKIRYKRNQAETSYLLLIYVAYRTFFYICKLTNLGKGRWSALPACVVSKIRGLYLSKDGMGMEYIQNLRQLTLLNNLAMNQHCWFIAERTRYNLKFVL